MQKNLTATSLPVLVTVIASLLLLLYTVVHKPPVSAWPLTLGRPVNDADNDEHRCLPPAETAKRDHAFQSPTHQSLDTCPDLTAEDMSMQPHVWSGSPIVIRPLRLIYCGIPKNACTLMKRFAMRVNSDQRWNERGANAVDVHNPQDNGLLYLRDLTVDAANDIMRDPRWTRLVIVRDPIVRFAAAFLDKCCRHGAAGGHVGDANCPIARNSCNAVAVLSKLEEDAARLGMERINRHFLPQSHFCDMPAFSQAYMAIDMDDLATRLHDMVSDSSSILPAARDAGIQALNETLEMVKSVNHDTSSRELAQRWIDDEQGCNKARGDDVAAGAPPRHCDNLIAGRLRNFYKEDYMVQWNGGWR